MKAGQSIPEATAARSAMVGSGADAAGSVATAAWSAARSAGRKSAGARTQAALKSVSSTIPAAICSRYQRRGIVTAAPATRANRAPAAGRVSWVCPRNGLTATLDAKGQTGGIARAARSAARSRRTWWGSDACR